MLKSSRRSFLKTLACASVAAPIFGVPTLLRYAKAEAPITLKFGTYEPPNAFNSVKIFIPWIEKINAAAKDLFQIEYYPSGVLGPDPTQQLKMLLDGVADISLVGVPFSTGRFPEAQAANLPMVADTMLEASLAAYNLYSKGMYSGYQNLYPISINAQPQFTLHTTEKIRLPQDLKGKKIRTAGKMQQVLVAAAGGTSVSEGISKIAESVSRGVYQGTLGEWMGMKAFRVVDVTPFHYGVTFGTNLLPVLMNQKKFDSLPPAAQEVITAHSGLPFVKNFATLWDKEYNDIEAECRANPKHDVTDPTPEEAAAWAKAFEKPVQDWIKEEPKRAAYCEAWIAEVAIAKASLKS